MLRTSPTSVLFASYNLLNLFAGDTAEDREHYEMITGVIRSLGTDVLAVQEILASDADTAARRLRQLADDAGLRCEVPGAGGGRNTALAFGGHGYHVGLMWRDGIEPVPGTLRCYGGRDFWHGLAVVTLDVGGTLIRHGAFHATPFSRGVRADQNTRLVAAITRPEGQPPALVGADWNTECADRVLAGQSVGALRARRSLCGRRLVRRSDLPVPVGLRRAGTAQALGRPAAGGRALGRRPARCRGAYRRPLASHDRPPPARRLRRTRGTPQNRRHPRDRVAGRRDARAPGARHRADSGGLRSPAGDGRVPAERGAPLGRCPRRGACPGAVRALARCVPGRGACRGVPRLDSPADAGSDICTFCQFS